MKKSKQVVLTLLSSVAMSCSHRQPSPQPGPYDGYNYYGRSGESGYTSSHFVNGMLEWYLISRMFNGYGYYPHGYYGNDYGHYNRSPRGYTSYSDARSGFASASRASSPSISRGRFGGTGYGRGGGA